MLKIWNAFFCKIWFECSIVQVLKPLKEYLYKLRRLLLIVCMYICVYMCNCSYTVLVWITTNLVFSYHLVLIFFLLTMRDINYFPNYSKILIFNYMYSTILFPFWVTLVLRTVRVETLTLWVLSNLSAPVPCVLSNFRCKLVKSNNSLKFIITLKVFNILTSSYGISISGMLFTLCIVYTSLHNLRPSYYHIVFTLYNVVVLEKIKLERRSLNRF